MSLTSEAFFGRQLHLSLVEACFAICGGRASQSPPSLRNMRTLKIDLSNYSAPPVQVPTAEAKWGQRGVHGPRVSKDLQSTAVIVVHGIAYFVQQEPEVNASKVQPRPLFS